MDQTDKKHPVDSLGNTMEDYDRWGTPKGIQVTTSKPTPAQRKLVEQINAERAKQKQGK